MRLPGHVLEECHACLEGQDKERPWDTQQPGRAGVVLRLLVNTFKARKEAIRVLALGGEQTRIAMKTEISLDAGVRLCKLLSSRHFPFSVICCLTERASVASDCLHNEDGLSWSQPCVPAGMWNSKRKTLPEEF